MLSKRSKIVLFTDSYPYGRGEQFLESELLHLASAFEEVLLVPLRIGGNREARPVPDGVRVESVLLPGDGRGALLRAGLFNWAPIRLFLQEFLSGNVLTRPKRFAKWLEAVCTVRCLIRHTGLHELITSLTTNDLCYFYWGRGAAWALPFFKFKAKRVVRFHGGDLYEERKENDGYLPFRKQLLLHIDAALFVSEHGKKYLAERYGPLSFKSSVSRLGVEDYGISTPSSDDLLRIVSCSFMFPVKRLHLIAEALALLEIPVEWTHLGDGSERDELDLRVRRLPQHCSVNFLGQVSLADVRAHLTNTSCDVFLNVSASEGVPVSVMEALASGIPVLATDVGGTSELVDDCVGKLLPADLTAQMLASELEVFYRDKEGRAEKAASARKRWEERASAPKNYEALISDLQSLVNRT